MSQPTRPLASSRQRSERPALAGQGVLERADFARLAGLLEAAVVSTPLAGLRDPLQTFAGFNGLEAVPALYAALGAVAAGQFAPVRGTLLALLAFQAPDGEIPARLTQANHLGARVLRALGRGDDALARGLYTGEAAPAALLLWVAAAYVGATGDRLFLQAHHDAFTRALAWLEVRPAGDLSDEALTYRALRAHGELSRPRGEAVEAARTWARAASHRDRVNQAGWDVGRGRYTETGDGAGNLLALAVGLAGPGQARAIAAAIDDGFALEAPAGLAALAFAACGDDLRTREAIARTPEPTPAEAGCLLAALSQIMAPQAKAS